MRQVVLAGLMTLVRLMNGSFEGMVEISVCFVLVMLAGVMVVVKLMNWSFEEVGEICAGFVWVMLAGFVAVVRLMTDFFAELREICVYFFLVTFGICFSSLGLWLVMRVFFVVSSMSSWGSFSL